MQNGRRWFIAALMTALLGVAGLTQGARAQRPLKVLLVIGGCCHDYSRQKDVLVEGLSRRVPSEWTVAYDPDTGTRHLNPIYAREDWARGFDLVVHNECSADVKDLPSIERILRPHREGLPAVLLHCAMHSYRSEGWPRAVTPWFEFCGLQTTGHGPQLPIQVEFSQPAHEITRGLSGWTTGNEELYNNSAGRLLEGATPLAVGRQRLRAPDGTEREEQAVVAWVHPYRGKARVFGTTLGHNTATVADERYLDFVARGMRWVTSRP